MKSVVLALVLCLFTRAAGVRAQDTDPLSVTLPSGRVVHFQTEEQKARFQTAQARVHTAAVTAQSESAQKSEKPFTFGHTAADHPAQTGGGTVNVNAPTFSADYYLGAAPETWVGKSLVLSVAYLRPAGEMGFSETGKDGMRQLYASTWGNIAAGSDQNSGGGMMILAPPEVATRLLQSCGTQLTWMGGRYRTFLVKGELGVLPAAPVKMPMMVNTSAASTRYVLTVAK